jgi:hypothetical protein
VRRDSDSAVPVCLGRPFRPGLLSAKKRHTADTQVLRTSCCLQSFVNLRLIGRQSSKAYVGGAQTFLGFLFPGESVPVLRR